MTFPPTTPLERLQVADGLLLTAERWQLAHAYHRQRQNLHFQSLHQAGIVCGLGVSAIPAPAQMPAAYRDGRWLQIQPGIAIDRDGNPIVVPQPVDYHIVAAPAQASILIYLVIRYVDPDRLEPETVTEVVRETFRIEEKVLPPDETEIELCRILLRPGIVQVRSPVDCFQPTENEIDLRQRSPIQNRPQGNIKLGYITIDASPNIPLAESLVSLSNALEGLYPTLNAERTIGQIALRGELDQAAIEEHLIHYDLLHLSYLHCQSLQDSEFRYLQSYLRSGGVLLIETTAAETNLDELVQVRFEVLNAIAMATRQPDLTEVRQDLETELNGLNECMVEEIQRLLAPLQALETESDRFLSSTGTLSADHLLRSRPFQFIRFPVMNQSAIEMLNWGGIVLVIGELSAAWGYRESLALHRETIRSAQELGINLLHFAWQRRQMMQCLTPALPPAS